MAESNRFSAFPDKAAIIAPTIITEEITSEGTREVLSPMETEISLVQVFQTMIASKEECPAEITTMLQN